MQNGIKNREEGKHGSKYNEYWSYKMTVILPYGIVNTGGTKQAERRSKWS